ncbi:hypothetical protein [Acidovorax sp. LjRoot117]|jgi:hypothetical protein
MRIEKPGIETPPAKSHPRVAFAFQAVRELAMVERAITKEKTLSDSIT